MNRWSSTVGRMVASLLVVATACGRDADSPGAPTRVAPPTRFVTAGDGIVLDSRTHLEWTSRDHERSLAWNDADRHCRESKQGDRTGWRLPEIEELKALYDKHADQPCGHWRCGLDPAIRLADPFVWSASARGPGTRFYLDFMSGMGLSPNVTPRLVRRVLCVRLAS